MPKFFPQTVTACVFISLFAIVSAFADDGPNNEATGDVDPLNEPAGLSWHHDLDTGIADARRRRKPVLVRATAKWCHWCRKLDTEIAKSEVQKVLEDWVLVEIDTDESPDDARRLNIGPIPALRILSPNGRSASSLDGFQTASKLLEWLNSHGDETEDDAVDVKELSELSVDSVSRLVRQLSHRDGNVREAVIRRLSPGKGLAALEVAKAFSRGNLATRLATLELLSIWKAPVTDVDPWRPDTVSETILADLTSWAGEQKAPEVTAIPEAEPLTPDELAESRIEIAKILTVEMPEAEAIGARLARFGPNLVPEVREQRNLAESDKARSRLDWLRYRLTATDSLSLRWPGGLIRLASTDPRTRHEAAGELSQIANSGDELLLIELFSHTDPLIRELSLKALHGVEGAHASEELSRLLLDPEPNVRAAVLKQLSEKPSAKFVPQIAEYVSKEKDPDLIVHAVRLLRAIGGKAAVDCLISQLSHSNWQVRAETVDALGEIVANQNRSSSGHGSNSSRDSNKADVYAAILEGLSDQDGFVVSRAVNALKSSQFALAAEPMAKAAETHPELSVEVGKALMSGGSMQQKALPILRTWLNLEDDRLRAAAVTSLYGAGKLDGKTELIPALKDRSERVRLAAATQLLLLCKQRRPAEVQQADEDDDQPQGIEVDDEMEPVEAPVGLLVNKKPDDSDVIEESSVPPVVKAKPNGPNVFKSILNLFTPPTDPPVNQRAGRKPKPKPNPETLQQLFEAWLTDFRSGKNRPDWLGDAIEPLETMLNSESISEQVASGIVLVALGKESQAIPVLSRLVSAEPNQAPAVSKVLGWLPWEQRIAFFQQLRQLTQDPDHVSAICGELIVLRDLRASQALWDVLGGDHVTGKFANSIFQCLLKNHRLNNLYANPRPKPVGVDAAALQRLASEGQESQRRVALAFLLLVNESKATESAKAVYENLQLSTSLRKDAFSVLLLSCNEKDADRATVTELTNPDSVVIDRVLAYMTLGESALQYVADGEMYLTTDQNRVHRSPDSDNRWPKDLAAETLRPLLKSPNEDVVAQASYILAMMGEPDGLDRLIKRWRKSGAKDSEWRKLVYNAISVADDARYVPVLDEIYRSMAAHPYYVRDLYWAIRTMHGPEVLKLRKRIREEVGMDQLR